MASIKLKFRPSLIAEKKGTLYYQIIHNRKVRQLSTNYHIDACLWDKQRSNILLHQQSVQDPNVIEILENIHGDMELMARIIRILDKKGLIYSTDDIIAEFERYKHDYSLSNFMQKTITSLMQRGQIRTAETYRSALKSFNRFLIATKNATDIMLNSITSQTMLSYEAYMKSRGNTPNTTSFYMRIIRAVYNQAVENGIIENCHPFRKVFTGLEKTVKRALPTTIIRTIRDLNLTQSPHEAYARDMFMMSFYLRGISFIDMSFLRKSDLRNGYLTYRRRKTGQQLRIRWTHEMQDILNRYEENPTRYLLPIILREGINERKAYRNASEKINRNLKKIASLIGISIPLTLYCARHSWASAAQSKGIPIGIISEGMGHNSEATTRIYLASLDAANAVDRANALILESL